MNKKETYQYLADRGIRYEVTEHQAVFNMAELDAVELPYPEADAKNLFVRNLLLNEKNELHNREMHISGTFKKQDIGGEKQDMEGIFPYRDVLKANGFKTKSLHHVEKYRFQPCE